MKKISSILSCTTGCIKLFTALIAMIVGVSAGQASQSVTFAWDASVDANVSGYILHYGTLSGVYTNSIDIGSQTITTVPGLTEGVTYYFVVTAYNAAGLESAPSNELVYQVPIIFPVAGPALQMNLGSLPTDPHQISFLGASNQTYELQATENFQSWATIWYSQLLTSSQVLEFQDTETTATGMRFYRLIVH